MRQRELTYRELRAVQLLAQGLNYKEIAAKMGLSVHTVNAYMQRSMAKMGANHRAHLVFIACQTGLLKLDQPEQP